MPRICLMGVEEQ